MIRVLVAALLAGTASQAAGQMQPPASLRARHVTSVALSPDGRRAAFTLNEIDVPKNLIRQVVFIADSLTARPRRIADGVAPILPWPAGGGVTWSAGGDHVAWLGDDGGAGGRLWVADARAGGAVRAMRADSGNVGFIQWSPSGERLAIIASQPPDTTRRPRVASAERTPPARLYLVEAESLSPRLIPTGDHPPGALGWAPDGRSIAFSSAGSIYTVELATGEMKALVARPGRNIDPVWSPKGDQIAFVSQGGDAGGLVALGVVDVATGAIREAGGCFDAWLLGDKTHFLAWSADGRELLFSGRRRMSMDVYSIDLASGGCRRLTDGASVYFPVALDAGRNRMIFAASGSGRPDELFTSTVQSFRPTRMAAINAELEGIRQGETEVVGWTSRDSTRISGLLTLPPDYVPGRRYPLVVLMEGTYGVFDRSYTGRVSADGTWWMPFDQYALAQRGYAVLMPNPRGSWTFGEAFQRKGTADFATGPYEDIVSGVDWFVRLGLADSTRLAIMGTGYDGYRTLYALTRTQRFKAAIVMHPIFNLSSFYAQQGGGPWFDRMFGGPPWKVPEVYSELSPMTHADRINTPVLIAEQTAGLPFAPGHGRELYNVLQAVGTRAELLEYPGPFSLGGFVGPVMLVDWLNRQMAWLDELLKPQP